MCQTRHELHTLVTSVWSPYGRMFAVWRRPFRTNGRTFARTTRLGQNLRVEVRDNNIDQALRVLKKKMQREGVFREMKARSFYEKPSEKRVREKQAAISRARKVARKQQQREGLLPGPKKKPLERGAPAARA